MNLQDFSFPKFDKVDMAFPTAKTDPILLQEAKDRGFYRGETKENDMFSQLFYRGGTIIFKKRLPKDFVESAHNYLCGFIGSWAPKHEEKEAICALILSEIAERIDPIKKSEKKQ
jgi:hypothetical protein